ncbi:hypothetical protein LXA43DRAFT_1093494 [Ganoderma leucocontextum]|nr:hypothetical protein LXA43DRAFT_1093494 [Ganoderma leucocontextum]
MPFLHHLEMLSNSTCSELCFSNSSQSSDTCSLSSSPSDLAFDTVSQPPSDALLAADAPTVATVALPREDPRVGLTPVSALAAGISIASDGHEEPQTIRKLVLRKRTTSPYQIKLPLMTDRLRVRNGKLVIHTYSEKDTEHPSKPTLSTNNGPKALLYDSAVKTLLLPEGVFSIHAPVPVCPPHRGVLDPDAVPAGKAQHDRPLNIRISPPRGSAIPAADTWTEICEDLCRAREVLSVLSDLDIDIARFSCKSPNVRWFCVRSTNLVAPKPPASSSALMMNSTSALKSLSPDELSTWLPLDKTFGAYLLGTFLGLILYGLIVHQAYRYYHLFHSDDSFIRLLVGVVLALETLHTALTMYLCYNVLVTYYGNLGYALASGGPWSLNIQPVLNSITALSAQLFFARRVYEMGSRFHIAALSAMLLLAVGFGFAIGTAYQSFATISTLSTSGIGWLISAPVGVSLLADLILTTTLTSVLWYSRSGLEYNNTLLGHVVIYVVNTGLLHCILNALGLAFTIDDYNRSTLLVLFFGTISTRVYANSFLSVLNSRNALAKRGLEVVSDGSYAGLGLIAQTHRQAAAETWNVPQAPEPERTINVQISTEHEEWEKHNQGRVSA